MHSLVRLVEHHLPFPLQTDSNGEHIDLKSSQDTSLINKPCMALDSESQSAYLALSINSGSSLIIYKTSTAKVIILCDWKMSV